MSCLGDNIFQILTGRESCWKIEIRDVEKKRTCENHGLRNV